MICYSNNKVCGPCASCVLLFCSSAGQPKADVGVVVVWQARCSASSLLGSHPLAARRASIRRPTAGHLMWANCSFLAPLIGHCTPAAKSLGRAIVSAHNQLAPTRTLRQLLRSSLSLILICTSAGSSCISISQRNGAFNCAN